MARKLWRRARRSLRKYKGRIIRELWMRATTRLWRIDSYRIIARRAVKKREPQQWVFLVGCYNSGTTLTKNILGRHPEIRVLPREGEWLAKDLPCPEDMGWTRMWIGCPEHMEIPENETKGLADRIIMDWSPWWGEGGKIFLEKSIGNVTRMQWLDAHFGNAYFIGLTRNGYCAAEGIRRRARPRGPARAAYGNKFPIEMAGKQWVDANERMLQGAAEVQRYIQISYEDFMQNPVTILNRIWDFLGVARPICSFNEGNLRLHESEFIINNLNAESIATLSAQDIGKLNPIIGPMQRLLGYEVLENGS